jgi:hypothetical protein
LALDAVGS